MKGLSEMVLGRAIPRISRCVMSHEARVLGSFFLAWENMKNRRKEFAKQKNIQKSLFEAQKRYCGRSDRVLLVFWCSVSVV